MQQIDLGSAKLDKLIPIWDECGYYHTCMRADGSVHVSTLAFLGEATRPNIIHAHALTLRERQRILDVYLRFKDLIDLIVWDPISRRGVRADIRYYGYEVRKRIIAIQAMVFDDDISRFIRFLPESNSKPAMEDPHDVVERLKAQMMIARLKGQLVASISETPDYMHKSEVGSHSTIRSGVFLELIDQIIRKKGIDWNMFLLAHQLGMLTNEDILSSGRLIPEDLLRLYRWIGAIGNRSSNDPKDFIRYECAMMTLCHLPTRIATDSMQTKFKRNFSKGQTQAGWLAPAKDAVMAIKDGKKTISYRKHAADILKLAKQKVLPEDTEFAAISKGWSI